MNLPNISPTHDYYPYWYSGVMSGATSPDEWQAALMSLTQQAEDEGVFYTKDMMAYFKAHADFIPSEWWSYQYLPPKNEVENGIMGMELYSARCALRAKREREADIKALESLFVGQKIGAMSVNHKRVNKCVIESIKGNTVTFTGVTGRYGCRFWTEARNVQGMIDYAIQRGWRK